MSPAPDAHSRGFTELEANDQLLFEPGSVVGTVIWEGELPLPFQFEARADTLFCGENRVIEKQLITIDPKTFAVQGALIYLADIRAGAPLSSASLELRGEVSIEGCVFQPTTVLMPVNAALELVSHDSIVHTPALQLTTGEVLDDLITSGMRRRFPVREPGRYSLGCRRHIWENATVFVVEHPYYTVTNAAGEFRIPHVPAGSYTLELYHPTVAPEPVTKNGMIVNYKFSAPIVQNLKILVRRQQEVSVDFVLPAGGARFSR